MVATHPALGGVSEHVGDETAARVTLLPVRGAYGPRRQLSVRHCVAITQRQQPVHALVQRCRGWRGRAVEGGRAVPHAPVEGGGGQPGHRELQLRVGGELSGCRQGHGVRGDALEGVVRPVDVGGDVVEAVVRAVAVDVAQPGRDSQETVNARNLVFKFDRMNIIVIATNKVSKRGK